MKQLLRDARSGQIEVAEVPAPRALPGCILVRVEASLVSAGTERAAAEFASKNLLAKAKARPDLVREVLNKVRRNGLFSAVQAVRSRLDQPLALGYSSAGTVIGIGEGVSDIGPGERVACAGAGHAVHAEQACIPRLLVAKMPQGVSFEAAAFTTLGAVAMHGIRTAEAKLGDVVAVIGLGLLGQLTVQLLKAAGCRVLGHDLREERVALAQECGADASTWSHTSFPDLCRQYSNGAGVDCVVITAETSSSDLVNLAAEGARDRAIVAAVGTVGMNIERKRYYEKELDFRVSRAYGPGRYDTAYEQQGRDYPIGYVRWTENRNMEAFLQLMAEKKVQVEPLITHRFAIEAAGAAYEIVSGKRREPSLGVLLTYSRRVNDSAVLPGPARAFQAVPGAINIGLIGAGSFATGTLLPALKRIKGTSLRGVCTASGAHARHAADKFGFRYCTSDEKQIVNDPDCNLVVIATRHHLHCRQVVAALTAGKHVFCEKPLCTREEDLAEIIQSFYARDGGPQLMVGFNRRFAPMVVRLKEFLTEIHEPLVMNYRVNAGPLPRDHWVNDPAQGGGRILGEMCHFVDLAIFLSESLPVEVHARRLKGIDCDSFNVFLRMANGSQANIMYLGNGDRAFSKERLEVFGGGASAVLEDFRRLELARHGHKEVARSRLRQDKGHVGELQAFVESIGKGIESPMTFQEIVATMLTTFRIRDSVTVNEPMEVDAEGFLNSVLQSSSAGSVPA